MALVLPLARPAISASVAADGRRAALEERALAVVRPAPHKPERVAPLDGTSDEELMGLFADGDHAAFRSLFDRYAPLLLGLARRHLPSEDAAREVVQQTFFQLHAARHDYRRGARLRPWVVTIAMNLVREHYRRRGRRRESPLDAAAHAVGVAPKPELEAKERAERVRAALATLPDSQREVIELHWFQERPFAEVAAIVGAREGAVRVRAHRGYARLRELLAGELSEET